jgi:hypothetical protein
MTGPGARQNPGERPRRKVIAASTGERLPATPDTPTVYRTAESSEATLESVPAGDLLGRHRALKESRGGGGRSPQRSARAEQIREELSRRHAELLAEHAPPVQHVDVLDDQEDDNEGALDEATATGDQGAALELELEGDDLRPTLFPCPYCGVECSDDASTGELTHREPKCENFGTLSREEFLALAQQHAAPKE